MPAHQNRTPTGTATARLPNGQVDTPYALAASSLLQGFSDPDRDVLSVTALYVDSARLSETAPGSWRLTPPAGYQGTIDLDYVVSDGYGGDITAHLSFRLQGPNQIPTGIAKATLPNALMDTPYPLTASTLLQGFSDADGDPLRVAALFADQGSLSETAGGQWLFTPMAGYAGPVALDYVVTDDRGGEVSARRGFSLTETATANTPPVGSPTTTLPHGSSGVAYPLTASDLLQGFTDADGDSLRVAALFTDQGSLSETGADQWLFTPLAGYAGPVALDYVVTDDRGGEVSARLGFTLVGETPVPVTPALSITPAVTVSETHRNQILTLQVSLSTAAREAVTVQYAARAETAKAGSDFVLKAGRLRFNPGELEKTLSYTLKGDTKAETSETFRIVLSAPKNATLLEATAQVTILDDDQKGPLPLSGTTGNDVLTGVDQPDRLRGLGGDDTLQGLGGADTLEGETGNDLLEGGEGDDRLLGGDENDSLNGGGGADTLEGGEGDDVLQGGSGADRLLGGAGSDTLSGGAGDDFYEIRQRGDRVSETGQADGGSDTIDSSIDFSLAGADLENVEHLSLSGLEDLTATGNDRDNRILGNPGNNRLAGGAGRDTLRGGEGDDSLDGGGSADVLEGGNGSDTYLINSNDDTLVETAKGGDADTVQASIDYVLGDYLENLFLEGTASNGSGNRLHNILTGNVLPNRLVGKDGDDDLAGGLGHDTLEGGTGNDSLDGGEGRDTAVFKANLSQFKLGYDVDGQAFTVEDIRSGADSLGLDAVQQMEVLAFDDRSLYLLESPQVLSVPEISGFLPGTDRLVFQAEAFGFTRQTRLTPLEDTRFRAGPDMKSGLDADDRVLYDTTRGGVYFDADGNGPMAPVALISLVGQPPLQAGDFGWV